jgi:hypothetical protein
VSNWFEKKTKPTVADYLNNFEQRRRFRERVKSYLVIFFFLTYGFLLFEKIDDLWVTRREESITDEYLKRDSVYRDSLKRVIHQMEDELMELRYELKNKKKR